MIHRLSVIVVLISFFLLLGIGCQSASTPSSLSEDPQGDKEGVAIIVGNPKLKFPKKAFYDFTFLFSEDLSQLTLDFIQSLKDDDSLSDKEKEFFSQIFNEKDQFYLSHNFKRLNLVNDMIVRAFQGKTIDKNPIYALTDRGLDDGIKTKIEAYQDEDPHSIRLNFLTLKDNTWREFYLFTPDGDDVKKGLYFSINPDHYTIETLPHNRMRTFGFAFDFTDLSRALIVIKMDRHHREAGHYMAYQFHYQCDLTDRKNPSCLWERWIIPTAPPIRELVHSGSFWWDMASKEICSAQLDVNTNPFSLLSTIGYTADTGLLESCDIPNSYWPNHSTDLMFLRYKDEIPYLGTGLQYYSGKKKTGFDQFKLSDIDTWVHQANKP